MATTEAATKKECEWPTTSAVLCANLRNQPSMGGLYSGRRRPTPLGQWSRVHLSLDLDEEDPRVEHARGERRERPGDDPVEAVVVSRRDQHARGHEWNARSLRADHARRKPSPQLSVPGCMPLRPERRDRDDEPDPPDLAAERHPTLPRHEPERRDGKDRHEDEERLGCTRGKKADREDASEVDRHGHEEKTAQRRGCADLGDEEVLPAGSERRGHRRQPTEARPP